MNQFLRSLGVRFAHQAAQRHISGGNALDPRRGWAMLRDHDVPFGPKAMALGIGAAATAILVSLEVPIESIVGVLLPVVGLAGDMLFDGFEMIACPVLLATLFLPFLVPIRVEQQARNVTPQAR